MGGRDLSVPVKKKKARGYRAFFFAAAVIGRLSG